MGSIRDFFVTVNRDPKFRAEFLENPAEALRAHGVEVSAATVRELNEIMPIVRKHLPELGRIPAGYDALLDEVAHKQHEGHTERPGPLIL